MTKVLGSRIVLVEDNEDTVELLGALLTRKGFDVRSASDGLEAVRLIDEFSPHAALVDIGLPGIDGFEVARRVRTASNNSHVMLIGLTGYGRVSDRERAIKAGFDTHVLKPVGLPQLLAIMARHTRLATATT
jgi:DNA-binding response OmpR family regulator